MLPYLVGEFPGLVSYKRFVDYIPSALIPLCAYLKQCCFGNCTGSSFVDSTSLDVCVNQHIASHKVFAGFAERGKTSTGWDFDFKLHHSLGSIANSKLAVNVIQVRFDLTLEMLNKAPKGI